MNEHEGDTAPTASGSGVWEWNLGDEFRLSPLLAIALGFPARSFQGMLESALEIVVRAAADTHEVSRVLPWCTKFAATASP